MVKAGITKLERNVKSWLQIGTSRRSRRHGASPFVARQCGDAPGSYLHFCQLVGCPRQLSLGDVAVGLYACTAAWYHACHNNVLSPKSGGAHSRDASATLRVWWAPSIKFEQSLKQRGYQVIVILLLLLPAARALIPLVPFSTTRVSCGRRHIDKRNNDGFGTTQRPSGTSKSLAYRHHSRPSLARSTL